MVNSPDAPGGDPCTVTGIRAIDEPGGLEITVGCSRASLRKDRPGEHPRFGQFRHRLRLAWDRARWGPAQTDGSESRSREVSLRTFIQAVRQAARDTDAKYQASMARRREWAQRDAQARRERQADPARRARLAEERARIDAALAQTGQ